MLAIKSQSYTIDDMAESIIYQAKAKGWSNNPKFVLFQKLPEEDKEFVDAVVVGDKVQAMKELVDGFYMRVQAVANIPSKINYTYANAFDWVWNNNWESKKKTIDQFGNQVRL